MHLSPYPDYQDGPPWLGAVPAHWTTVRVKRIATINPSKSEVPAAERDQRVAFLPMECVGTDGRIRADERRPVSELWTGFTYFKRGDVILAKITPCFENGKGACLENLPTSIGFGSTEFHVLRPTALVSASFLYRLTTHSEFRRLGAQSMTGGAGQQRVPDLFVSNFVFPLPPPAEQAGIVRFLGAVDRKVNRFIRAKRRLIEVLTEQKQAIITHAVTKGLNPHAPLKPSGIDWLGDVPEHWQVARAGSVAEFISTKAHEQFVEDDGEHICVTARFVSTDGRSFRRCTKNFSPARRGDVLMVMSDLPRGRALARAYFVNDDKSYAVNQRVCILRPKRVNPRYLAFATNRHAELLAHDDGFNQTHLPNSAFKIMRLALPPLKEQERIVESLVRTTSAIDAALERTEREIDLIREYRTRLVADVVTGKVDVRAAAAAIPDQPPFGLPDADLPEREDEIDTDQSGDELAEQSVEGVEA